MEDGSMAGDWLYVSISALATDASGVARETLEASRERDAPN